MSRLKMQMQSMYSFELILPFCCEMMLGEVHIQKEQ
jgi:hypothetical protein